MKLKLKELVPNPYRDFKLNPYNQEKLEELKSSIDSTGFWDNVSVRQSSAGKYEIVAGHHRIKAAIDCGITEHDFKVEDLTNSQMLERMSRENREAYNTTGIAIIESVQAVVQGLAEGTIEPFDIPAKTKKEAIRYAPSYIPGGSSALSADDKRYTSTAIADKLGYTRSDGHGGVKASDSVKAALDALYLIEIGELRPESVRDLPADVIVNMAREAVARVSLQRERSAKTKEAQEKAHKERVAFEEEQRAEQQRIRDEWMEAEKKRLKALDEDNRRRAEEETRRQAQLKKDEEELDKRRKQFSQEHERKQRAKQEEIDKETQDKFRAKIVEDHAATLLNKLNRLLSEADPLREDIKKLASNPLLSLKTRDLLYKAMINAGDRFDHWSTQFAQRDKVDVLEEARKRESARQRRGEA